MKKQYTIIWISGLLFLSLTGCTKHQIESRSELNVAPVEIKPIHITIDINIKVDRALDDFFGDIDQTAEEIKSK